MNLLKFLNITVFEILNEGLWWKPVSEREKKEKHPIV